MRLVNSNIAKCKADKECTVLKGSAISVAERLYQQGKRFDFAFCDPPYSKGWIEKILAVLAKSPFLKPGGYLVVERSGIDELPPLPEKYELVRSEKYGSTKIDFIYFNNLSE